MQLSNPSSEHQEDGKAPSSAPSPRKRPSHSLHKKEQNKGCKNKTKVAQTAISFLSALQMLHFKNKSESIYSSL